MGRSAPIEALAHRQMTMAGQRFFMGFSAEADNSPRRGAGAPQTPSGSRMPSRFFSLTSAICSNRAALCSA
jgi:hypothetical protein